MHPYNSRKAKANAELWHANDFLESVSNCSATVASSFLLDKYPREERKMFPWTSYVEPGKPQTFPQARRRGCLLLV